MGIKAISDAERAKRYRRKLEDLAGKADTVCRLLAQKLDADSAGRELADEVYIVRQQLAVEDEFNRKVAEGEIKL